LLTALSNPPVSLLKSSLPSPLSHEGSSDSAGQECVNTLVKESEDRAGEVVIILAGYSKEMATFLSTNSGLTSRFPNVFAFADYVSAELAKVGSGRAGAALKGGGSVDRRCRAVGKLSAGCGLGGLASRHSH
jgi:hypothetical protein